MQKKCPFENPMVWGVDGKKDAETQFFCEFLDDDTWECSQKVCPFFWEVDAKKQLRKEIKHG